ncbi:reverse gyrase [Acidianus sulfidivorans JP7]|uniref:Reverse gyrase n=1 Tax=Acidianus sulfidivorans JP7 TaxID=619593 RepID=A0A2U9IPA8_9CREN|nr:reverse gyrase [Acidianus sulfidivorans]AWR97816.1 reverse gyrase [Acidianus sulfidivorans JP7]
MVTSVYLKACPNCQGPLDETRALEGLPCTKCLPGDISPYKNLPIEEKIRRVYNILVTENKLNAYWNLYYYLDSSLEIINYFKQITNNEPWSLQKLWLKRLIQGTSFSMSAPTGMGKTTTIIVFSTFLAKSGKSVLYIVPTKSLLQQICGKMKNIYNDISCGEVDEKRKINIVTTTYINRNFDKIKNYRPNFIAVDDADSIVKSGKTVDRLVTLMGIPGDVYEKAIRLVKLKRLLAIEEKRDEIEKKIAEIERDISKFYGTASQLVVASATLRPKGIKQKALRYITGFDVTTAQIYARNIIDAYTEKSLEEIITLLGKGGLILVSREYGKQKIKEIAEYLESKGIKVAIAISGRKFLDKFSSGEVDIIIGSASYYGVAVRGIDEPKKLKYVVFYGVPKSRIRVNEALYNPFTLLRVSKLINVDIDENKILSLGTQESQMIKLAFIKSQHLTGKLEETRKYLEDKIKEVKEKLSKINENIIGDTFLIRKIGKETYIEFPDVITYLQGSGRSSRLLNDGLTLGLSITLVDDKKIYEMLTKRLKYTIHNFNPVDFSSININEVMKEIERTREESGYKMNISTGLMIVESPTKARTIAKLFGTPARRNIGGVPVYETVAIDGNNIYIFDIMASKGHISDLTTEQKGYYGVEISNNDILPLYSPLYRCLNCKRIFTEELDKCPYCGSELITSSLSTVNAARELALEVDNIYIATDPDVEGEKIGFDLAVLISPYNNNIKRVKIHEITKKGIIEALRSLSTLDLNLVKSQEVRRIEDRWVGFELSKILQVKFSSRNYGAGRVQTPVLGWIVKRTEDYRNNMGYLAFIQLGNYTHKIFLSQRTKIDKIKVDKIKEETDILTPLPPYTTDTLLIDAYNTYKLPAERVMKIAQELFESGLITYHRTDSTHISTRGIEIAKEYLEKNNIKDFVPRIWGSEGTHEAIRPTRPIDVNELKKEIEDNPGLYYIKFSWAHFAIYDMIFKRFIASQMKEAIGKYTTYRISYLDKTDEVKLLTYINGGFSVIFSPKVYQVPEGEMIPTYKIIRGSKIRLYNYAEIIKEMKDKNIGRPSTYAKIIQTLIKHGYVVESKKRAVLIATKKGINVYNYLTSKFSSLVSESTTVDLLQKMDLIAKGLLLPDNVLTEILGQMKNLVNSLNSEEQI